MPEIGLIPDPDSSPPSIRVQIDADTQTLITDAVVRRDGEVVRSAVADRTPRLVLTDYEMPYGTEVTYDVQAAQSPTDEPMLAEDWEDASAWSGDGWVTEAGSARTQTDGAVLTSTDTVFPFDTATVSDPANVSVELIEVIDDEDGPVESTTVTVTTAPSGTTLRCPGGTRRSSGAGSYTVSAADGEVSVAGEGWDLSQACAISPTRIRVTANPAGHLDLATLDPGFTLGEADRIAATDDALFVLNRDAREVVRVGYDGDVEASWSLPSECVDLAAHRGLVYVADMTNQQVVGYDANGTQVSELSASRARARIVEGTILNVPYQGVAALASGTGANQVLDFVRSNGVYHASGNRITRLASHNDDGQSTGSASSDLWGLAAGAIYKWRSSNGTSVSDRPSWTSQATDLAITDQVASWLKFELWGSHVRESIGQGVYTGTQWQLVTPATRITTNSDGSRVVTANDDGTLMLYGPQSRVGSLSAATMSTEVAEPFSLSGMTVLEAREAWLVHPSQPGALSVSIDWGRYRRDGINVDGTSASDKAAASSATVIKVPGRSRSVVTRFGARPQPEWSLTLHANSWASRDEIMSALRGQEPLLLRSPRAWPWDLSDGWYSVGDVTDEARIDSRADIAMRIVTLPLTPVERPAVIATPPWTYGSVLLAYGTLKELERSGDTWLDVLLGNVRLRA